MTHYRKIVGEKVYLSPPALEDALLWAAWDNDLEVTLPLGDEAYTPMTVVKEEEWISEIQRHQAHTFSVVDVQTDEVIGRCMLFSINNVDRCAMLGIVIGEKSRWNQGCGQEALRLLLDYAFNLLNLHNVMLGVFSFNQRAIQAYQKVGFKEIGRRRQARCVSGHWYDVILMDILAGEFNALHSSVIHLP